MQYIIFHKLDPLLEETPWPVVRFLYSTTSPVRWSLSGGLAIASTLNYFMFCFVIFFVLVKVIQKRVCLSIDLLEVCLCLEKNTFYSRYLLLY